MCSFVLCWSIVFVILQAMWVRLKICVEFLCNAVVELVEWRTAESEVSDSNPRARF